MTAVRTCDGRVWLDRLSGALFDGEGVHHEDRIAERVEHRAGAAFSLVFLHFRSSLVRRAGGRDAENQLVGDEVHGLSYLLLGSRPAQNGSDLPDGFGVDARRLGDVRLLRQILGDELLSVLYGTCPIPIDRADWSSSIARSLYSGGTQ